MFMPNLMRQRYSCNCMYFELKEMESITNIDSTLATAVTNDTMSDKTVSTVLSTQEYEEPQLVQIWWTPPRCSQAWGKPCQTWKWCWWGPQAAASRAWSSPWRRTPTKLFLNTRQLSLTHTEPRWRATMGRPTNLGKRKSLYSVLNLIAQHMGHWSGHGNPEEHIFRSWRHSHLLLGDQRWI